MKKLGDLLFHHSKAMQAGLNQINKPPVPPPNIVSPSVKQP